MGHRELGIGNGELGIGNGELGMGYELFDQLLTTNY